MRLHRQKNALHLGLHKLGLNKLGLLTAGCLTLSACMGTSGGQSIPLTAPNKDLKQALCAKSPAQAINLLNQQADTPANNLYAAIAMEQGGRLVSARTLYQDLVNSGAQDGIKLTCDDSALNLSGSVSTIAAKKLNQVEQILKQHDVNLTPRKPLHAGLKAMKDPAASKTKKTAKTAQMNEQLAAGLKLNTKIVMPPSANLSGTWFAHFASYFDAGKATNAITIFEKRYAPLKGSVGVWTVSTAKGTVWRVGVAANEWADTDRLCVTIRSRGAYCKVIDRLQ